MTQILTVLKLYWVTGVDLVDLRQSSENPFQAVIAELYL